MLLNKNEIVQMVALVSERQELHETQGAVANFMDNVTEQLRHSQLAFTVLWDTDASSLRVKGPSHFPSGRAVFFHPA